MKILLPAMPLYTYIDGIAKVTNYFFLSSIGDDSQSGAQAQNSAMSRNTISSSIPFFICPATGEHVLFERNEISYNAININKTGISNNPIETGTCNKSVKPIMKGFAQINTGNKNVY